MPFLAFSLHAKNRGNVVIVARLVRRDFSAVEDLALPAERDLEQ